MLRRERVQRLAMGAISASSTIRSVPQRGQRVARAKLRLVNLFLAALVPVMARTQDKVVVHQTPTGIILASASVTTTITALVVARTLC
jgi:hypothetical protein